MLFFIKWITPLERGELLIGNIKYGRQTPTVSYYIKYKFSLADEAKQIYEKTGLKTYDWQYNLLKPLMATDTDGLWTHQKFGYSLPRRNGKTVDCCAICGKEYTIDFLISAHIKKRSLCDVEERRDINNNVFPMCKFGCDDLFENGYIGVRDGRIVVNRSKITTHHIDEYLNNLPDQFINYSESNKAYFDWHFDFHSIEG